MLPILVGAAGSAIVFKQLALINLKFTFCLWDISSYIC